MAMYSNITQQQAEAALKMMGVDTTNQNFDEQDCSISYYHNLEQYALYDIANNALLIIKPGDLTQ